MNPEQLISCALDIGEQMLVSGAEIGRVEVSIRYICLAYGCQRADVFTITSSIVVSLITADGRHITQTRRINGSGTDLEKLHKLNHLSRYICQNTPDYQEVVDKYTEICSQRRFPVWVEALASALIACSFTLFFGGSWFDGMAALILGVLVRYTTYIMERAGMNQVFTNVTATFLLCLVSAGLTKLGIGENQHAMNIGTIMLLIPGVALTNSLRDMISGDIMSGLLRFFNAVLIAAAIAAGYILAGQIVGGL